MKWVDTIICDQKQSKNPALVRFFGLKWPLYAFCHIHAVTVVDLNMTKASNVLCGYTSNPCETKAQTSGCPKCSDSHSILGLRSLISTVALFVRYIQSGDGQKGDEWKLFILDGGITEGQHQGLKNQEKQTLIKTTCFSNIQDKWIFLFPTPAALSLHLTAKRQWWVQISHILLQK